MRKYFVFLFLAFAVCSTAIAAEPSTNDYAILPTSEGPALLNQCSRPTPQHVTNYWSPSTSQIAAMEKLLPEFLRRTGYKRPFSNFSRQYMGIIINGKQLIYLNALPRSAIKGFDKQNDWRTKPLIICDGGDAFWGVVFDPADDTFHDLAFNGMA